MLLTGQCHEDAEKYKAQANPVSTECQLNVPSQFSRRRDCGPSHLQGWYCYQAIYGEIVDVGFNVLCDKGPQYTVSIMVLLVMIV